ncbi:hypothetical protein KP509_1Z146200 [Ceratopteris richardii]|nr:hypothetical protein KP509_1Z146200 [Ceratopteris richardii]
MRGGIPICFPHVRNLGSLEQQSLVRCHNWTIDPNPPPPPTNGIKAYLDLLSRPTAADMNIWAHNSFELRLRVSLGMANLTLTTRVKNIEKVKALSFNFAICTYISVSDISEVRIEGLETTDYLDNLKCKERFTEQGNAITFDGELDRVYLGTPTKIAIIDHEKKRTFELRKDGLPDAVVWNPWDKKSKTIADLGDDDYMRMLCIESAAVEKSIVLKPGQEWKGRQEITAVLSSYCSGQFDRHVASDG